MYATGKKEDDAIRKRKKEAAAATLNLRRLKEGVLFSTLIRVVHTR